MPDDENSKEAKISAAARRALSEAQARRNAAAATDDPPIELGGRDGPEPIRFGDWEKNGLTSDF
jgi:hypothetical protein